MSDATDAACQAAFRLTASHADMTVLASPRSAEPLDVLDAITRTSLILTTEQTRAVARARAAGYSWNRIGTCLGTTRQAAQQRYGSQ